MSAQTPDKAKAEQLLEELPDGFGKNLLEKGVEDSNEALQSFKELADELSSLEKTPSAVKVPEIDVEVVEGPTRVIGTVKGEVISADTTVETVPVELAPVNEPSEVFKAEKITVEPLDAVKEPVVEVTEIAETSADVITEATGFFASLEPLAWFGWKLAQVGAFVGILSLSVAALVLADRKIWAAVQMRRGPNVVGAFGLLQTIADALKFFFKEIIVPAGSDKFLFILAPVIALVMAFLAWAVVPVAPGWVMSDINLGVLYVLAISSLGVYGIIVGGWASNSKYPFMGALRSAAQMVSYEVSIGFIILSVIFLVGSMNLTEIVEAQQGGFWNWHMFYTKDILLLPILFAMGVLFFISALAETNRPPFDLPEAESELVAGYQVEYSSTPFLMYFFGEYVNIMLLSAMMTILFLGGWYAPVNIGVQFIPSVFWFLGKMAFIFFLFAMVKAIVPRYRYDQLMRLGWKVFLPMSLAAIMIIITYVTFIKNGAA